MIFFLDTSILIDMEQLHFPIDKGSEFWDWLLKIGQDGLVKIPESVYDETDRQYDRISKWLNANRSVFLCKTIDCIPFIGNVLTAYGYGTLNEGEIENLVADPYVIAHALAVGGTVVTSEKPNKAIAPRAKKIPGVCEALDVPCLTLPGFMWKVRQTMPQ